MGSYFSKDALCPYYQYDDPGNRAVVCEGVLPGTTIRSRFPNKDAFSGYLRKHCCDRYKACPWYRVASMKYGKPED